MDAIRSSINIIIDKYKRDDDEPSNPENLIEFTDIKKVPLYPELNDDELSNSEMLREGLLNKIADFGAENLRKSNESPRVLKEFSSRGGSEKSQGPQESSLKSQRNSENNVLSQEKRESNKSDTTPGFNDKSL